MNEATSTGEILELGEPEKTMVVENMTTNTLRFSVSHPDRPHKPILDETRTVDDGFGGRVHPPKMFGDPRFPRKLHARFLDEVKVEIPPRAKMKLPLWMLSPAMLVICCDLEKNSYANARGVCHHLDDPEHRKCARIMSGGLVGPEQVSIDFLSDGPIPIGLDSQLQTDLEDAAAEALRPIPRRGARK